MKPATFIAMLFLILVAIAHAARAILQIEILANGYSFPLWASWVAAIILLLVAIAMWNEHKVRN